MSLMGDPSVKATEESRDAAQEYKLDAIDVIVNSSLNEAIDYLSEHIFLNPNQQYSMQREVEPNAQNIEEHCRRYDCLIKEREFRKMERERPWQQAEAQSPYEKGKKIYQPSETKTLDPEAALEMKDGQVIGIHSYEELESKLNAATRTSRLAILYFTATWCGPCRYMSPVYTALALQHPKLVFLKADIDEDVEVALRCNVSSIPIFYFIKDGKLVEKVVCVDQNLLEKIIAEYAD